MTNEEKLAQLDRDKWDLRIGWVKLAVVVGLLVFLVHAAINLVP